MVLQHMLANFCPNRIELLLENSNLFNSLKIEPHLILAEALNLEVSHEQRQQPSKEIIDLDVLLDILELFGSLGLVALHVSAQTRKNTLFPRVQLNQLKLQIFFRALEVLQSLLIGVPHLIGLQKCLDFPFLLLHVEIELFEMKRGH